METQSSTQNVTGSTPGPWRVEDVGIPGTLAIMAGSTTEYRWIATVTEDMGSGVDWTQTQANAQLIAAAHDLLEACMEFVAKVDRGEARSVRSYAQNEGRHCQSRQPRAMTHVKTLYIGRGSFTVSLECGHVQHVDGWRSIPRPGSAYDCPDCRAQEAHALAEQFTAAELARLRFWQWLRLMGRAGS